MAKEKGQMD